MENVEKTIDDICNWIQKELKDDFGTKNIFLPEMIKALAELVAASAKI